SGRMPLASIIAWAFSAVAVGSGTKPMRSSTSATTFCSARLSSSLLAGFVEDEMAMDMLLSSSEKYIRTIGHPALGRQYGERGEPLGKWGSQAFFSEPPRRFMGCFFMAGQPGRHLRRHDQTARVRDPLAHNVVRGPVGHAGPHDRQSHADVHRPVAAQQFQR